MSLGIVAIPERMADAVAVFDLDNRESHAPASALASRCVVDVSGADGSGLAVFATPPQVRAEVGLKRIIGCGRSRIKS
jgi:hypothetical protein